MHETYVNVAELVHTLKHTEPPQTTRCSSEHCDWDSIRNLLR